MLGSCCGTTIGTAAGYGCPQPLFAKLLQTGFVLNTISHSPLAKGPCLPTMKRGASSYQPMTSSPCWEEWPTTATNWPCSLAGGHGSMWSAGKLPGIEEFDQTCHTKSPESPLRIAPSSATRFSLGPCELLFGSSLLMRCFAHLASRWGGRPLGCRRSGYSLFRGGSRHRTLSELCQHTERRTDGADPQAEEGGVSGGQEGLPG